MLAPNVSMALEATFGFPMAGVVFNALNSRLSAPELAWIVGHAESKVLFADHGLADVARSIQQQVPGLRLVVSSDAGVSGTSDCEYEALLSAAQPHRVEIADEHSVLSLNYTSGTTGNPKGVMYSHRGANLNALAMAAQCGLDSDAVFLWTLPIFHCNGWCFPWAVTAVGGVHLMLRTLDPGTVWRHIRDDGVTHFNAAPTVLIGLVNHPDAAPAPRTVKVCTGGAPPSPTLLAQMAELNVHVTHLYGLTETYGPSLICDWRSEWDGLPASEQARIKARQGVGTLVTSSVRVIDSGAADVPADGTSQGEIAIRGNNVMLGYYKDPEATAAASVDGPGGTWFRTGDMAVMHDHGYVEVRDRAKDVIISGGENIASIEVEQALASHPDVGGVRGGGRPRRHLGRGTGRVRGAPCGSRRDRGRPRRAREVPYRPLQGPQVGNVRRPAQDGHRQDPEVRAARSALGRPGPPRQLDDEGSQVSFTRGTTDSANTSNCSRYSSSVRARNLRWKVLAPADRPARMLAATGSAPQAITGGRPSGAVAASR